MPRISTALVNARETFAHQEFQKTPQPTVKEVQALLLADTRFAAPQKDSSVKPVMMALKRLYQLQEAAAKGLPVPPINKTGKKAEKAVEGKKVEEPIVVTEPVVEAADEGLLI
jgi:hypothetical protein